MAPASFPRLSGGPPEGSSWPAGWARPSTMAVVGGLMAVFGFTTLVIGLFALGAASRDRDVRVLVLGLVRRRATTAPSASWPASARSFCSGSV